MPLKSLAVSIAVIIGLLGFQDVPKAIKIPPTQNEPITQKQNTEINKLINRLSFCESNNNPLALNKIDKNGKSSKGQWQFQNSSWKYYIQKYDLWNNQEWDSADFENAIWDGQYQKVVVEKMFTDPDVNLLREFPSCSKIIGLNKNYYE